MPVFPETDLREQAMSCADATTQAFGRLAVNDGFVFAADRAPVPLRYLVEAERAGQFAGKPLPADDDGVWRVRVSRVSAAPGPGVARLSVLPGAGPSPARDALSERMMTHRG